MNGRFMANRSLFNNSLRPHKLTHSPFGTLCMPLSLMTSSTTGCQWRKKNHINQLQNYMNNTHKERVTWKTRKELRLFFKTRLTLFFHLPSLFIVKYGLTYGLNFTSHYHINPHFATDKSNVPAYILSRYMAGYWQEK